MLLLGGRLGKGFPGLKGVRGPPGPAGTIGAPGMKGEKLDVILLTICMPFSGWN